MKSWLEYLSHPVKDVSTSLDSPPEIQGKPFSQSSRKNQLVMYPDLHGIQINQPADEVYKLALTVIQTSKNWQLLEVKEDQFKFSGIAKTPTLGFIDDWSIEIRPTDQYSCVVHMRSRSRLGRSDLGANAKRIKQFFSRLAPGSF